MGAPLTIRVSVGVVCILLCTGVAIYCFCCKTSNKDSRRDNDPIRNIDTKLKMKRKYFVWSDERQLMSELNTVIEDAIPFEPRLPSNASSTEKELYKQKVEAKLTKWRETLKKTLMGGNDDT